MVFWRYSGDGKFIRSDYLDRLAETNLANNTDAVCQASKMQILRREGMLKG